MENLKDWLLCISAFATIGSLMYFILPRDRISDTVKTVMRFIMLTLIFLPLCRFDFSPDKILDGILTTENDIEIEQDEIIVNLLTAETEGVIHEQVADVIETYYTGTYKIEVQTDILSDNCIHIKQIRIILFSKANNPAEIREATENLFPTCEIIIEQEVK